MSVLFNVAHNLVGWRWLHWIGLGFGIASIPLLLIWLFEAAREYIAWRRPDPTGP